jgi:hypothetical protein
MTDLHILLVTQDDLSRILIASASHMTYSGHGHGFVGLEGRKSKQEFGNSGPGTRFSLSNLRTKLDKTHQNITVNIPLGLNGTSYDGPLSCFCSANLGLAINPAVSGNLLSIRAHKSTPPETPHDKIPETCRYTNDVVIF